MQNKLPNTVGGGKKTRLEVTQDSGGYLWALWWLFGTIILSIDIINTIVAA